MPIWNLDLIQILPSPESFGKNMLLRVGLGILVSIVKEPTEEREVASIDIGDKRNEKAERPETFSVAV